MNEERHLEMLSKVQENISSTRKSIARTSQSEDQEAQKNWFNVFLEIFAEGFDLLTSIFKKTTGMMVFSILRIVT